MSDSSSSYRQILKSTSIIGGASVINVLIGLVRIKLVAVMFGPVGIGFLALLNNIMAVASTVAAMGLRNVGTRQIAEAVGKGDEHHIAVASRALLMATAVLSVLGAAITWLLREPIAEYVLGSADKADAVAWIALGVFLTVVSGSQGALLNGLRKINELAKVTIGTALVSTLVGIPLLWWGGEAMLPVFVLLPPLTTLIISHIYARRIPKQTIQREAGSEISEQIKTMLKLGGYFMLSGLVLILGLLFVRMIIQDNLGIQAVGYFEAAWIISMTYVGFVLGSMAADYYPRLTAVIHDKEKAVELVNDQAEMALLLLAPILVAVMALAPWAVRILYSSDFTASIEILRWQVIGDALKILSWPLGFVILAAGEGRIFLFSETFAMLVFSMVVLAGIQVFGLVSSGIGFVIMYSMYLPIVYFVARSKIGFRFRSHVLMYAAVVLSVLIFVFYLTSLSESIALVFGLLISFVMLFLGLQRVSKKVFNCGFFDLIKSRLIQRKSNGVLK